MADSVADSLSDTRAAPPDPRLALPLWRQPEYRLLWGAQVVSTLGSHAAGIVVPLLILAMTDSPAAVGIASALGIVPYLLLCLPVGALIDRWDRRRVMVCCDLGRMLVSASVPVAILLDRLTLGHLYAVAAVHGTLMVFFNIAEVAALPRVVAKAQLPDAVAQNQVGYASAAIVGPALGSWAYQSLGRALPFVLDAVSYAASALALWRLRTDFSPPPNPAPLDLKREMQIGLRWLWSQRLVRDLAFLTGGSNFVHAALPLLMIVLAKAQGASAAQIGLIFSCTGVGAVLGGLVGPWVQRRWHFGPVLCGTLVLQALLLPLVFWVHSPLGLGLVYGAIMFCAPIYNVVQFSHRLALIPDGLQGRVNSAYRLLAHCLQPVGAALCGVLIEAWGTGPALALFGVTLAGLALVAGVDRVIRLEGRGGVGRWYV